MNEMIGIDQRHPTKHWHTLDDGRIQCDVCPRDCKLQEGERGLCYVRGRADDKLVLSSYARSSGFSIAPIEKTPLNHFFPGSRVFSFGTAGCNLACKFCQNWDIPKAREMDRLMDEASPQAIAKVARTHGCKSVAFNYNDPVVYFEYALDTADACHDRGLKTVAMTAGYIHDAPRREFFAKMDAANIDLKAFSDDFYVKLTGGHLQPVLDTLAYVYHETDCWLEITTLLIPGYNDADAEIAKLAGWIVRELGFDVPLHFSAFQPGWKMSDVPPTQHATLSNARRIALDAGLHYVYTGGMDDMEGDTTYCPACQHELIVRDWNEVCRYELTTSSACPKCGTAIAGHFSKYHKAVGYQRLPVFIHSQPWHSIR